MTVENRSKETKKEKVSKNVLTQNFLCCVYVNEWKDLITTVTVILQSNKNKKYDL